MPDDFLTFKMPVIQTSVHGIRPIYDPSIDFSVSNDFFKRHYVRRLRTRDAPRSFLDKLFLRHPKEEYYDWWVEVTIKVVEETEEVIALLNSKKDEVVGILTPEKYKNF